MAVASPVAEIDARFSSAGAVPTPWAEGRQGLEQAEVYWLATVRADGRPHVTPLLAIWQDDTMFFCTGPEEQKARNLRHNAQCVMTTGCNALAAGLDLVVEGDALSVHDEPTLRWLADQYERKYGWHFAVRDGAFHNDEGGRALVFKVAPTKAFGFGKGETYSQTTWRF